MTKVIFTDKVPPPLWSYSQAIEVNGMLFISGQISIDPKTKPFKPFITGGIVKQTERVLEIIKIILEEAGYTLEDVVKTTCYLSGIINDSSYVNDVFARYFSENPPAMTALEAKTLPLGARIQIEAIAVKSTS